MLSTHGLQIWDSTVLNGDDMSLFFSLGDSGAKAAKQNLAMQHFAPEQIFQV